MLELKVEIKEVYGVRTVYPRCDKSKTFAEIAKTITLTPDAIELIKKLGYTFIAINDWSV
jgi:hypothetical protein